MSDTYEEVIQLPNGCALYSKRNEIGGRVYMSDEVGGGVFVWDTSLVAPSTLIAALHAENVISLKEYHERKKANEQDKED